VGVDSLPSTIQRSAELVFGCFSCRSFTVTQLHRRTIGLDEAVGADDDGAEARAFGVSMRLAIFTCMGLSHRKFVSEFVSRPCDSVKGIEKE